MKNILRIAIAVLLLGALSGCTNVISRISDKINPPLSITLYSANGEIIKSWKGRVKSVSGILVYFETTEGKPVSISGTIVIEEAK